MKNRIIFRILGALSASLIIAAVFVPFISVNGYSQSIWQSYSITKTLYLPIMIIVFGSIAVLVFSINKKIEFSYSSCGALLFFLVTQSITAINSNTFSSYSVGYYFLVIGTVLTALMAFLCGLKIKVKVVEQPKEEAPQESSILNQIDKLYDNQTSYNDQTNYSNELNITETNDAIQPIQNSELLSPISSQPALEPLMPISNFQSPINENENMLQPVEHVEESNTNISNPVVSKFENQQNTAQPLETNVESNINIPNPVVSEFGNEQNTAQPLGINVEPNINISNPIVAEFGNEQTVVQPLGLNEEQNTNISNPVVSEFENSSGVNNSFITGNTTLNSNENNISAVNNNLDIFN